MSEELQSMVQIIELYSRGLGGVRSCNSFFRKSIYSDICSVVQKFYSSPLFYVINYMMLKILYGRDGNRK